MRKIVGGGKYLTETLAFKIAEDTTWRTSTTPHEALSNREYHILHMIALGKPLKQIAQELFISAKTISTYRARILRKMRMKSNAELIAYILPQLSAAA